VEFERFFAFRFPMVPTRAEALGARDKGMMRSRSRAFGTLLGFVWHSFGSTRREFFPASDELTGYPCETDVVTFDHSTKEEQSVNFTAKLISN
jgi:hypothetical protein